MEITVLKKDFDFEDSTSLIIFLLIDSQIQTLKTKFINDSIKRYQFLTIN